MASTATAAAAATRRPLSGVTRQGLEIAFISGTARLGLLRHQAAVVGGHPPGARRPPPSSQDPPHGAGAGLRATSRWFQASLSTRWTLSRTRHATCTSAISGRVSG